MNLIFLGPPGAGKGTIAEVAKEYYSIPHISTGDLFREAIGNETELGKKVKSILASGALVPDEVTIEMVRQRLEQNDAQKGYILDGFPRTVPQADALAGFAEIDFAVNFTLPRDLIIKRLSGRRVAKKSGKIYHIHYNPPKQEGVCDVTGEPLIQRDDDKPEAIEHRLAVYEEQTSPLINYYRDKGKLVDLDSSGEQKEILSALKELLS